MVTIPQAVLAARNPVSRKPWGTRAEMGKSKMRLPFCVFPHRYEERTFDSSQNETPEGALWQGIEKVAEKQKMTTVLCGFRRTAVIFYFLLACFYCSRFLRKTQAVC